MDAQDIMEQLTHLVGPENAVSALEHVTADSFLTDILQMVPPEDEDAADDNAEAELEDATAQQFGQAVTVGDGTQTQG